MKTYDKTEAIEGILSTWENEHEHSKVTSSPDGAPVYRQLNSITEMSSPHIKRKQPITE